MSDFFNIKRFISLIKYRFLINKKAWALQIAGVFGIAMIITAIVFIDANDKLFFEDFYQMLYVLTILLSGAYISSRSFVEYENTAKGFSYIMLPASSFEKFMIPALFSGILYFVIFSVLYSVMAIITNVVWSVFYDFNIYVFNPFGESLIKDTGILFMFYLIIQPIFLFGSIALRKQHFIITGIVFFIIFMVIIGFAMGYSDIVFGSTIYFKTEFDPNKDNTLRNYIIVGVFHVLMLSASYFKLKEREV